MHAIELSDDGTWTLIWVLVVLVAIVVAALVKGAH